MIAIHFCGLAFLPLFLQHKIQLMDYRQEEYQEELQKVQDRDFTHNWVSSSAFLFYLSLFCMLLFVAGASLRLYNEKYEKFKVTVPESTQYNPKYK